MKDWQGSGVRHQATSVLSDHMLEIYCMIRTLPDSEFGPEPTRELYGIMGALLAAMEATNEEMERLLEPAGE